jgi:hypothetical protein
MILRLYTLVKRYKEEVQYFDAGKEHLGELRRDAHGGKRGGYGSRKTG